MRNFNKYGSTANMLDESSFRFTSIMDCSTPIRASSDRSPENAPEEDMNQSMVSETSSSSDEDVVPQVNWAGVVNVGTYTSTPIRAPSNTSPENGPEEEMDQSLESETSSSSNDSAYSRLRKVNSGGHNFHALEKNNNQNDEMEPVVISDDSSDVDVVPQMNRAGEVKVGDESFKVRHLQIVLNRMKPDYIRDMMNGVKSTQSSRTAIVQSQRPNTNLNGKSNKKTDKRDASEIDYESWQWQPNLKLDRLTQNDLQRFNQAETSPDNVPPIEFDDSNTSFIHELSPETAIQRFERRLKVIKRSMQPISMKPNESRPKRSRVKKPVNVQQLEYEETHKRLQAKTKKRTRKAKGRKLYNPADSSEDMTEKENDETVFMQPKAKRAKTSSLTPIRILPNRSAKKIASNGNA